jgi:hypothetical protein
MTRRTSRGRTGFWRAGLFPALLVVIVATAGDARPDVIVLRGGTRVRGKVVADPAKPDRVLLILERGRTPMSVTKAQVEQVIEEAGPLDGYVLRRAAASGTAQAQFDLGSYCDQHKLPDLARLHFETALKLDPSFGPAHEKLGHTRVGDRWLSGDDLRVAQGLVKYRGRWVTKEEKQQHEQDTATAAEQSSWVRRIRAWREMISLGSPDKRRDAEAQLLSIRDPAAIKPLVRTLGTDTDDMRSLLARVLGTIPGAESTSALATQLVVEEEADLREKFLGELEKRNDPAATKTLVRALRSSETPVVNRAAWALAHLGAVTAVPSLIPALVTLRQRVVMVQPGMGMGPGEGPAITAAFGGGPFAGATPGPPIAWNGSTVAYLNGPMVGPGVVAYGATATPFYPMASVPTVTGPTWGGPGYSLPGAGISLSLGGSRGPVPQVVVDSFENTEVRAALVKLTGQDLGYNQAAWRNWLRTSFKPDPKPAKTVPQP